MRYQKIVAYTLLSIAALYTINIAMTAADRRTSCTGKIITKVPSQIGCIKTFNEIPRDKNYPNYPQRSASKNKVVPIPDNKRSWSVQFSEYNPPYPRFLKELPVGKIAWREADMPIDTAPKNPCGRTGIAGRGILGKWGPNCAADPIITRYDSETGKLVVLLVGRHDSDLLAIPGGMVDPGESLNDTARRELEEETGVDMDMCDAQEIYKGYVDDPRNTDNAWMETGVFHKHLDNHTSLKIQKKPLVSEEQEETKGKIAWVFWDDPRIKNLYASHSYFLKLVFDKIPQKKVAPFASQETSYPTDTAVVIVDVQGDFTQFKDGTLAVPNSGKDYVDAVIAATKELMQKHYKIFATQDWHPKNHISFAINHPGKKPFTSTKVSGAKSGTFIMQELWPAHAVQCTEGAKILVPAELIDVVIKKGTNPKFDSYSGFADNNGKETSLNRRLKTFKIKNLIIFGIATDFCVGLTALHATERRDFEDEKYVVYLIKDLCRGVDIPKGNVEKAISKMADAGVIMCENLKDLFEKMSQK